MDNVNKELVACVKWFLEWDDVQDIPYNEHWIQGHEQAKKLVAMSEGVEHEMEEWTNWEGNVDQEDWFAQVTSSD